MSGKALYLICSLVVCAVLFAAYGFGFIDHKILFIVVSIMSAAFLGYYFALLQKGVVPRLQGVVNVLSYIAFTLASLFVGLEVVSPMVAPGTALIVSIGRLAVLPSKNAVKS